jgi:hypothetical protein
LVLELLGQQVSSHVNIGTEIATAIIFSFLAPVFYGVLGFLLGILAAWIYNVVAKWTGGIEFEVE